MIFGLGAVAAIGRGLRLQPARARGWTGACVGCPRLTGRSGGGPGERAEQIAARIAMIDRTQAVNAGGAYSSREVYSRRTGEIADAVASTPLLVSDRLGQAYSRAPRPTTRRGEDN